MFTALLVVIGSVAPTVKDASSAFGGLVLAMFIPLYVTPLVASEPDSLITQVVTYFPLTAPIATQMRNATGTLSVPEGLAALVIVYATTGVLLWAAVRLFGAGSISYVSPVARILMGKAEGDVASVGGQEIEIDEIAASIGDKKLIEEAKFGETPMDAKTLAFEAHFNTSHVSINHVGYAWTGNLLIFQYISCFY